MKREDGFAYIIREHFGKDFRITFRPDGFNIDEKNRTITLIEEVYKNDLNINKLTELAEFWFDIDGEGWDVELIVIHWYGAIDHVTLMDKYYQYCLEKNTAFTA